MMATNYGASPLQPDSPERNGGPSGPVGLTEANRKRAVRLQKNREAARECRRKKKEYIKCLENRVAVLEVILNPYSVSHGVDLDFLEPKQGTDRGTAFTQRIVFWKKLR